MTDETDKTIVSSNEAEGSKPKAAADEKSSKGGLLANKKLLIFGGGGLVTVILIVVGVMFMLSGDKPSAKADESPETTEKQSKSKAGSRDTKDDKKSDSHATKTDATKEKRTAADDHADEYEEFDEFDLAGFDESDIEGLDFELGDDELSAIDQISASLDFLDEDPESVKRKNDVRVAKMSIEDSLEQINWLEAANNKLKARETAVAAREKSVDQIEREVSRKILIIEQAESTRVSKLAKLYDGMDPMSVAKMMANLDDATVVSIISRMKQKNASLVLALFSPQRGARLSKKMITIAEN